MDPPKRLHPFLSEFADNNDVWWAAEIVELFGFVEPLGYRIAELSLHHEGNYIRYEGPRGSIVLYYNPDSTGTFGVTLELKDAKPESLDSALLRLGYSERQPPMFPLDRAAVDANFRYWAGALRRWSEIIVEERTRTRRGREGRRRE
jgi:hypothetical protein